MRNKKTINEYSMVIPSNSENERFARLTLCGFVSAFDPTVPELADLRTALSEAVTNCIVHAYKEKIGYIYISVKCYEDRTIEIRIRDKGCGMEDVELCRKPLYTSDDSGERGGMGFVIMETFCDRISVRSTPGKGTSVTLVKKLS